MRRERDKSHLRTEKSFSEKFEDYGTRAMRTKTISEQDVFVPIHTKERVRLEIRRSIGKREERTSSVTKNFDTSESP
jgi:hypothetical protein